jgi:Fur family ferric uptake transcriptional regulator
VKEMNSNFSLQKKLKSVKLNRTNCRLAILKVLTNARRPLPQDQIAKRLGRKSFDKVTIYRTLESFTNAGLAHKAFLLKRAWHYELADNCTESQCHPHFTCSSCGQTFCMTDLSLPMARSPYRGFKIKHQQVRLEGLCPECK